MDNKQFKFNKDLSFISQESGVFSWEAPSNIALVKYWGKTDIQIP